MDITYNWLKEYVSFDLSPVQVADILTNIGLEVEHIEDKEEIPGGLNGVIVAHVVECEPHPNSDHLNVTKVDIGSGELLQVVCGAPNIARGQKVLLATINTKLNIRGEEVKIKRSKIRGVESFGMICAEDELGIGNDHEGIMVLPQDAPIGQSAKEFLNLKSDTVFTIGLTPNRVDASSLIGVARDLSAYLKINNLGEELTLPKVEDFQFCDSHSSPVSVEVKEAKAAPRYSGITIENITVSDSPDWLKKRLLSVGMRPINNIVDITNYILLETGNPLHAFDADKIKGNKIVVGYCSDGTKFTTLDGIERTLSSSDLMICNAEEPMCIAGVFGGQDSGVKAPTNQVEGTKRIFLESAYFSPTSIRKTSKRHNLHTEASFRYERGCDPNMTDYALRRAANMICSIAGGKIVGDKVDIISAPIEKKSVTLNYDRINSLIGYNLSKETIDNILKSLDIEIDNHTEQECHVKIPTYKVDVYRECDVVEEILRIYGYNNIPLPEGMKSSVNISQHPDKEKIREDASNFLSDNGFVEIMNNSLSKSSYYSSLSTFKEENCVMIYNPLSSDLNSMRQTLIFGGLEVVAYNLNRQVSELKMYEIGNVYSFVPQSDDTQVEIKASDEKSVGEIKLKSYRENEKLLLMISGDGQKRWRDGIIRGDYFALKGYMESLLTKFGVEIGELVYEGAPRDIFSEGLSYKLKSNNKELFVIGAISNKLLKEFGIKQKVYAAEISWDVLFAKIKKHKVKFSELPKYPEVRRDLALLLDYNVSFADIRNIAFGVEKRILTNVVLFDVYTGDKIPKGKKQYAISFYLQDKDKTLTDGAVDAIMKKLYDAFSKELGAELR